MRLTLTALLAGLLFGAGLAVAQMTNPAKVIGFLDVAGAWDPSLAFVMGAALLVSGVAVQVDLIAKGGKAKFPALAQAASQIDARLVCGAAIFGAGWGLAGFCPGPALAALVTGSAKVFLFVGAMLAGAGLFELLPSSRGSLRAAPQLPSR